MAKNQKKTDPMPKKPLAPMVEDETIASQLSALLTPAITLLLVVTSLWFQFWQYYRSNDIRVLSATLRQVAASLFLDLLI